MLTLFAKKLHHRLLFRFPSYIKLFVFILIIHAHFSLLHKLEKCVTERDKRLNRWRLCINWGIQFLIPADEIIENDLRQILCMFLEFFVKWREFGLFLWHGILLKLSKITDLLKLVEINQLKSIFTYPNSAKCFKLLKAEKWPVLKFIYLQSWRS